MAEPQGILTGNGDDPRALVVVFLRGAADGLNLVVPTEDDDYYRARPTLGIAKKEAVRLDGFFGLNPKLAPLKAAWDEGDLAIIHAAGSEDQTRSHFEAQDLMEHGGIAGGGWLARFLRFREGPPSSAMTAIALGRALPECLRGAPSATVMESLDDFSLGDGHAKLADQLDRLYQAESGALAEAGRDTLTALRRIEKLRLEKYAPENGADYGKEEFGHALAQVARLIKAGVGLEAASVDLGGWDSHFAQATLIDPLMDRLATGIAAFRKDLGRRFATTTLVVMTEFGRRVAENSAFGTDHGRGGVMLAMGGGIKGGRALGEWPGLKTGILEGPGDVPVTHNYRNALAPILARHGAKDVMDKVFPEFAIEPMDLFG